MKPYKVREWRQHFGLTQGQLAYGAGIDRVSVARYETGPASPKVSTAIRLAGAMGITVFELRQSPTMVEELARPLAGGKNR